MRARRAREIIDGASLATVTVLYPAACPATTRVQLLADALAV